MASASAESVMWSPLIATVSPSTETTGVAEDVELIDMSKPYRKRVTFLRTGPSAWMMMSMPSSIAPAFRLRADLDALADALEGATFGFSLDPSRADRRRVATNLIHRYLIPRLGDPEGALLVVLFGSTGSGKSTLVNSLAGGDVSQPGSLRPTTRQAVVWCHADNLSDVRRLEAVGDVEFVTADHPDLRWMSVVDTPDVDSVIEFHRQQTTDILALADAVIHVTTPQRYADAVPWEFLRSVAQRDLPMLVVTNRLAKRSSGAVTDLASLLRKEKIVPDINARDVVGIQEQRLRGHGRLPSSAVKRVSAFLTSLASDHSSVVRQSVAGTLRTVVEDCQRVLSGLEVQRAEIEGLHRSVVVAVEHQASEISEQLDHGDLVGSEVVQRWQRLIGVSDLAAIIARGAGRIRDVIAPNSVVDDQQVDQVGREAREAMIDLALLRVRRAHEAITAAWQLEPSGSALIEGELRYPEEDRAAVGLVVDEWLASLVDLVSDQGQRRFKVARAASIGVNAAATTLLIAIFTATGGITGAEVGVTAGAAAAQQSLLEHIFGGAAARRLAEAAQQDLVERLGGVVEAEGDRFLTALSNVADGPDIDASIRNAVDTVTASASEWLDG